MNLDNNDNSDNGAVQTVQVPAGKEVVISIAATEGDIVSLSEEQITQRVCAALNVDEDSVTVSIDDVDESETTEIAETEAEQQADPDDTVIKAIEESGDTPSDVTQ